MCLILFSYKKHPRYKLIVAANRDEFYARPTAPADYWSDHPEVMAGRDMEALGTWMGINKKSGDLAMLTNYRDLANLKSVAPSRGALVSDFLIHDGFAEEYYDVLESSLPEYNGFNLVLGNPDSLSYFSSEFKGLKPLAPGVYGLSNALMNSPWPKVQKGKLKLEAITEERDFGVEHLFEAMRDEDLASDKDLPETGVGLEKERMLSPMFIKSPQYGSRCTTVILVDQQDRVLYAERTYDTTTFTYETKYHKFKIGE
jgi:uncharacterized protein with NRDE domain